MSEAGASAVALRRFEAELMEVDVEVPAPFVAHEQAGGRPRRCAQAEAAALRPRR